MAEKDVLDVEVDDGADFTEDTGEGKYNDSAVKSVNLQTGDDNY